MLHTVQEAMILAGVSRRTLYNHCDAGRVSYSVGQDGRRRFETAELERAYGKLKTVAQSHAQQNAQQNAQPFTPAHDTSDLAKLIEAAVQRATAPLAAEIAELRETLMRLEHKPNIQPDEPTAESQRLVATGSPQHSHSPSIRTFGDLLSGWEKISSR